MFPFYSRIFLMRIEKPHLRRKKKSKKKKRLLGGLLVSEV